MKKLLLSLSLLVTTWTLYAAESEVKNVDLKTIAITQYESGGDLAQYVMMLSTSDNWKVDEDLGIFRTDEDGYMSTITLFAPSSAEAWIPLPDGKYTMGAEAANGIWWNMESYNVLTNYIKAENKTNEMTPESGELTVSHNGDLTVIAGTLTVGEDIYNIAYNGTLLFKNESADSSDRIQDPINTTFIDGSAIYKGVKLGYGVVRLELVDQQTNEEGVIPNGATLLKADINIPPHDYATGAFASVPAGNYEISFSSGDFTANPGFDDGENIPTGCYAVYKDMSGTSLYGMISDGSISIEKQEDVYTITADFTTEEGVSVKGTYSGKLDYLDLNSGEGEKDYVSTLTEDKTLDYRDIRSVTCRDFGDVYGKGVRAVDLQWIDAENMQATTIEFLLPWEDVFTGIPTGTFPVAEPGTYTPNSLLNGTVIIDHIIGTWGFSKLGLTSDGEFAIDMSEAGPAYGGDVSVSKEGDIYTIVFNLEDDAKPIAHKMTGTWSGVINGLPSGINKPATASGELMANGHYIALPGLPNPADMSIYDFSGRLLDTKAGWDGSACFIGHLSAGVYVLKVGGQTYKFVK